MAGRPRSAEVDRALRDAALSIFVERGLPDLTLDEVARRAGVSRAALYRRWSSREALLVDAVRSWRAAFDGFDINAETPPLDALLGTLAERVGTALADPFTRALLRRLLALGPGGDAIHVEYFERIVAPRRTMFSRAIVAAQEAGQVDAAIDPALAMDAVSGALAYKLLSGEADRCTFDGERYVLDVFQLTGLKRNR